MTGPSGSSKSRLLHIIGVLEKIWWYNNFRLKNYKLCYCWRLNRYDAVTWRLNIINLFSFSALNKSGGENITYVMFPFLGVSGISCIQLDIKKPLRSP